MKQITTLDEAIKECVTLGIERNRLALNLDMAYFELERRDEQIEEMKSCNNCALQHSKKGYDDWCDIGCKRNGKAELDSWLFVNNK